MSRRQCQLCQAENQELVPGMTRLAEPIGGKTFDDVQRCRDRSGCRTRVETSGHRWEFVDGEIDAVGDPQHRGFSAAHLAVFDLAREYMAERIRSGIEGGVQPASETPAVAPMRPVEAPPAHAQKPEDVFA